MIRINRSDFVNILVSTMVGMVVGAGYARLVYLSGPEAQGNIWIGAGIGGMIALLISSFEVFIVGKPRSPFRKLPFWVTVPLRSGIHLATIYVSIKFVQLIYNEVTGSNLELLGSGSDTTTDLLFSAIVVFLIIFYMQMRLFIGGRNLNNLMIGRYNQPHLEERIFMIMDVVGSTRMAQSIGDEAFHRYLNEVFDLADDPIHKFGGEVHSYVGDAIFAVWRVNRKSARNGRPLLAVKHIHAAVERHADRIETKYGIRPQVRIAIHRGPVIIGETGYRKRQITYLGNTVNLASRIEDLTKTGIGTYLASRTFLEGIDVPDGLAVVELGEFELKGSQTPIALGAIRVA